ncbi:hypothetical protein [Actinacidiphila acididurans]|uniref:Uncharacterized protein n=1 Tax=Actinacidiphila acididurans TaxID=2784346 RepID=A0ABS2TMG7_9ACTN|nr:hypothetical protein [Actinacidiphila acididurans]MBM9504539.1 hypothetical protein [Actinacidiphila acididurans]
MTEGTEVYAEPYEEDPAWDGTVEAVPADEESEASASGKRGRRALTLPAAAARYERARHALARLDALDVDAERAKILARIERDNERLSRLDGHEEATIKAREELSAAQAAFNAACDAVTG